MTGRTLLACLALVVAMSASRVAPAADAACVELDRPCTVEDICCNGAQCDAFGPDGGATCGLPGACRPTGAVCRASSDCCSSNCDPNGTCGTVDVVSNASSGSGRGCACDAAATEATTGAMGVLVAMCIAVAAAARRRTCGGPRQ